MYPVLFKIGPLTIYSLGLFWALGALAAAWILRLELKRYGYDPEIASSIIFAAAIAGLLGARLLFIVEEWENFTQAPFQFILSGAGFSHSSLSLSCGVSEKKSILRGRYFLSIWFSRDQCDLLWNSGV